MVWEVDKNPFSVSLALVSPEHEYDQSVVTVAEVLALSPLSAQPAKYPLTTLVAVSALVTPPKADSPL